MTLVGYTVDTDFVCYECSSNINRQASGVGALYTTDKVDCFPICHICHKQFTDIGLSDDGIMFHDSQYRSLIEFRQRAVNKFQGLLDGHKREHEAFCRRFGLAEPYPEEVNNG